MMPGSGEDGRWGEGLSAERAASLREAVAEAHRGMQRSRDAALAMGDAVLEEDSTLPVGFGDALAELIDGLKLTARAVQTLNSNLSDVVGSSLEPDDTPRP